MTDWEYATTYIRSEQRSSTAAEQDTRDALPTQLTFAGVGPDGEPLASLGAVFAAWADAGWELLTLTYQPVDVAHASQDLPQQPVESTVAVVDGQLAVFRRARGS